MKHLPESTSYGIAMDAVFDSAFQDMEPHKYVRPFEDYKSNPVTFGYTKRCLCDQKKQYLKNFIN